ncbi:MAG TPA: 8-amino-7-oxononanoate synthase [Armatimonadota bacterium]
MEELARFLEQRKEERLLRRLSPLAWRAPARAATGDQEYIDFSSNDYLGLSAHPALIRAAQDALVKYGVGAGASRLMSGDLDIHHALEEAVAAFKGAEAALVFNSGYQANTGLLPALVDRHDVIFADSLSHASLLDGAVLSRAKLIRFRHNDMDHLADLLHEQRASYTRALLVTESVFSMDGDRAPLRELVALKERYHCRLLVDEAHATGIFGPQGRGCVEADGLTGQVEFVMGTFSKALGGFGAFLASTQLVKDYLVNAARSFIYSTALPPAIIAANLAALQVCRDEPSLGKKLLLKADRFRKALQREKWKTGGESQIIPVLVGESARALALSAKLAECGFRVLAVRPPTVPEGQARLRFSLCSAHNSTHLIKVLEALNDLR